MRRRLSVSIILSSIIVVLATSFAAQSDVTTATYKENKMCLMCHKMKNPEIVTAWQKSAHANAFWKVGMEKEGQAITASITPTCPVKKDQIAYVLGVGERRQAYLDASLNVLPAEWIVSDKTFKSLAAADGAIQCIACHVTGYDKTAKIWVEPGVTCQSCHGPGSEHMSSADKKGTIVRPQTLSPQTRAAICGQCHSAGKDPSGKFAFPVDYKPGQDLATKFVDAKPTTHAPQQQYSELIQSPGHWKAGVVCDTCHDPHGVSTQPYQLRKPINELCLDCHKGKITGSQHADASLQKTTCAVCHMPGEAHYFKKP